MTLTASLLHRKKCSSSTTQWRLILAERTLACHFQRSQTNDMMIATAATSYFKILQTH